MQSKTQQFVRWYHYVIYNYMFRPDDGPLTRPKHVVVYYVVIPSDKLLCF